MTQHILPRARDESIRFPLEGEKTETLGKLFFIMQAVTEGLVSAVRSAGKALELAGRTLEKSAFVEKLQPSLQSVALSGTAPSLSSRFVAPTATVVGKVNIGDNSSVWYGAVMRGKSGMIGLHEAIFLLCRFACRQNLNTDILST